MEVKLDFFKISEKLPKEGDFILYVHDNLYSKELVWGEVYYVWEELDEDGDFTGNAYFSDEDSEEEVEPPENTKLCVCVDGVSLVDDTLYTDMDVFFDKVSV